MSNYKILIKYTISCIILMVSCTSAVVFFHTGDNCTLPSIDEFPNDLFSEEQRMEGALAIHIVASIYLFIAIAVVCNVYFVPATEKLCKELNISEDVGGASFMAAATSTPELFVSVIGTFITEGDIGVGTIVGSAVYNILAVGAICGFLAGMTIQLQWWAITRDSIAYTLSVIVLIWVIQDSEINLLDAVVMLLLYFCYVVAMYFDKSMQKCMKNSSNLNADTTNVKPGVEEITEQHKESSFNLMKYPTKEGCCAQLFWIVVWPIHFFLRITILDFRKFKNRHLFWVTFLMCVLWIASLSYVVAWMLTVIGDTLRIPDSIMGITFLAAGTSVPETVACILVARRGFGSMGICQSIGSNTFDILMCLGLPWLVKSAFYPAQDGQNQIVIKSGGIGYLVITLLSAIFFFYMALVCNKFKLDKKLAVLYLLIYLAFLVFASLIEMNVFFDINLPPCPKSSL